MSEIYTSRLHILEHFNKDMYVRRYFRDCVGIICSWAKKNNLNLGRNMPIPNKVITDFTKSYFAKPPILHLLQANQSIDKLFEELVTVAIIKAITDSPELTEKVNSIYGNVKLVVDKTIKLEIDSLIMLKTGDLIAFEAKTGFNTRLISSQKDLESRIKNIRDLTGAYTQWALIFPYNQEELKLLPNLKFKNKIEISWKSKDKKIIMMDEIAGYLHEIISDRD